MDKTQANILVQICSDDEECDRIRGHEPPHFPMDDEDVGWVCGCEEGKYCTHDYEDDE